MPSATVEVREDKAENFLTANLKQRTYLAYIALVRILLGYHFIGTGLDKLFGSFLSGKSLLNDLARGGPKDPFAWHHAFISGFVVPHVHFFSYLVTYGELAIGISLLLGCLVRISSSFGAFHNMNIWLASGGTHLWNLDPKTPAPWEARIDSLMRQQMITPQYASRKQLFDRVQELAAENLPFIPLVTPNILVGARKNLGNLRPALLEPYTLWNVDELYWQNATAGAR